MITNLQSELFFISSTSQTFSGLVNLFRWAALFSLELEQLAFLFLFKQLFMIQFVWEQVCDCRSCCLESTVCVWCDLPLHSPQNCSEF